MGKQFVSETEAHIHGRGRVLNVARESLQAHKQGHGDLHAQRYIPELKIRDVDDWEDPSGMVVVTDVKKLQGFDPRLQVTDQRLADGATGFHTNEQGLPDIEEAYDLVLRRT